MHVFVLNSGSTSLKFGLFDASNGRVAGGDLDWADGNRSRAQLTASGQGAKVSEIVSIPDDLSAASRALEVTRRVAGLADLQVRAIGHRVVHGGAEFRGSVVIDTRVKQAIDRLGALAPLHNPPALRMVEAMASALPGVPQIAVFDTAFHSTLPPEAIAYPVPYEWFSEWGIRRFGFHGRSHAYCARRAAQLLGRSLAGLRLVSCHLGGGCSVTAVQDGQAVATTMGFSPLEGLMMCTRSGTVDPGILLHVQREHGLTPGQMEEILNYRSGLLGVSGMSGDLALLEEAATRGHERARLAIAMFDDRVRSAIGAMAATLGGLDVLVFTDRIGEKSHRLRASVCERLNFLGLRLDPARNGNVMPDADVAAPDSTVRVLVVRTQEELMVAEEVWRVIGP